MFQDVCTWIGIVLCSAALAHAGPPQDRDGNGLFDQDEETLSRQEAGFPGWVAAFPTPLSSTGLARQRDFGGDRYRNACVFEAPRPRDGCFPSGGARLQIPLVEQSCAVEHGQDVYSIGLVTVDHSILPSNQLPNRRLADLPHDFAQFGELTKAADRSAQATNISSSRFRGIAGDKRANLPEVVTSLSSPVDLRSLLRHPIAS